MTRHIPVPEGAEKEKFTSITDCLRTIKAAGCPISRMTMISWVEKNHLGFQPTGTDCTWYVDKVKFLDFLITKGIVKEDDKVRFQAMLEIVDRSSRSVPDTEEVVDGTRVTA